MKRQNIFIDTDMGNDDIMAIMLLLLSSAANITGISVVNGVATKDNGYKNLLRLFSYLEIKFPTVLGYQRATMEKKVAFPIRDIIRANNLTLLRDLPITTSSSSKKQEVNIEEFIYQTITKTNSTLLALGPLTNIAKTITKYGNKFTNNVKEIVMMGGGIKKGNVAPDYLVEYNIWLDPEAAKIVFSSSIPITMVGIDATNCTKVTNKFMSQIKQYKPIDKKAKILKEIIINNDNDFSAFYDPLTAYLLLNPKIIAKSIKCSIEVIIKGRSRGQTIPIKTKKDNVKAVMNVYPLPFYKQLISFMLK